MVQSVTPATSSPAHKGHAAAPAAAPQQKAAPARVTVQLPSDARLKIDETVCPLTSETRTFDTPPLEPGKAYYYILTAEVTRGSEPVVEKQRVIVEAGKAVTVEFKNLPTLATARR